MEIPKQLKDEIWDYCRVNNISNIDEFTLKLLKQGFTVERFGAAPQGKIIEKEVEKIIEVPVEKIVEKIVEVPIAMENLELSDNLKKYIELYEETKKEVLKQVDISDKLKKELEIEKKKNKKDIYGES